MGGGDITTLVGGFDGGNDGDGGFCVVVVE
jgi:hypothetical protein